MFFFCTYTLISNDQFSYTISIIIALKHIKKITLELYFESSVNLFLVQRKSKYIEDGIAINASYPSFLLHHLLEGFFDRPCIQGFWLTCSKNYIESLQREAVN